MKNRSRLFLLVAALFGAMSVHAEEAPKTPPPEDTIMIVDLRTAPAGVFQYGSWNGKLGVAKSGMMVQGNKGAQGDGGMGQDIGAPRDFSKVAYFEVALGTAPTNEVPQFTIALNDADGTQFTARVTIDQIVPGSPVWMRARRSDFQLNSGEKGSDSKMDWSRITRWHLQGDWQTKKPFQVLFIALRARPELAPAP